MKAFVAELVEWLGDKRRILAVTHTKPDGDALGSLYGFAHLMGKAGKVVHIYLDKALPSLYQQISALNNLKSKIHVDKGLDISSYDGVVVLDAANETMTSYKGVVEVAKKHNVPLCVIDHHQDNQKYGTLNIVEPYAAAAAILADFALEAGLEMGEDAATCLMLGVMRDTGGFRFQNTDPLTLRLTADLIEKGADYHGLTQKVFFNQPLNRMKFISYVINNKLQFACNGRVLFAVLEDDDFDSFGLHKQDMEGLIDYIRTVEGVVITCIFTHFRGQIKLSLRSCDERYPVNTLAQKIGGGGHKLAAGARTDGESFGPVIKKFLSLTEDMFNGKNA